MDLTKWKPYYKLDELGRPCKAQMAYEPLVNPENNILCMNFSVDNKYQNYLGEVGFVPKIVHTLFEREYFYLDKFKDFIWCPEMLDVDHANRCIFLKWNNCTCNDIIAIEKTLERQCPTWKEQLELIIKNQLDSNVYKTTVYQHCHFIDIDGIMKSFDYYGTFAKDESLLTEDFVAGMIHRTSNERFNEAFDGQYLNIKTLYFRALEKHVYWPDNHLNTIYKKYVN